MAVSRLTKAAVATAAGAVLLLGAGGTFANWYERADVAGATITAGELSLTTTPGVWKDASGATIDPSTYRMVPGDTVTWEATATPTLVGDNLKAKIAATGLGAEATGLGRFATVTLAPVTTQTLTAADSGKPVAVKATVTLPFTTGDANGTDGEKETLTLTDLGITLTQVAA